MFKAASTQNQQIIENSSINLFFASVPHPQNGDGNPSCLHMMLDKIHSLMLVIHGHTTVKAPQDPKERGE